MMHELFYVWIQFSCLSTFYYFRSWIFFIYYFAMLEHGFRGRHEGSGTITFSYINTKKLLCFISYIRIYGKLKGLGILFLFNLFFLLCNYGRTFYMVLNIFRNHIFDLLMPSVLYYCSLHQ